MHFETTTLLTANANSDELLHRCVDRALRLSGYPELRNVRVRVCDGRVTLEGSVTRYYIKQLAQTVALSADGVAAVENDLLVC